MFCNQCKNQVIGVNGICEICGARLAGTAADPFAPKRSIYDMNSGTGSDGMFDMFNMNAAGSAAIRGRSKNKKKGSVSAAGLIGAVALFAVGIMFILKSLTVYNTFGMLTSLFEPSQQAAVTGSFIFASAVVPLICVITATCGLSFKNRGYGMIAGGAVLLMIGLTLLVGKFVYNVDMSANDMESISVLYDGSFNTIVYIVVKIYSGLSFFLIPGAVISIITGVLVSRSKGRM